MRGMRFKRRGMDCLVRGMKSVGDSTWGTDSSEGLVGRLAISEGCVVVKLDWGAGAVEGRSDGLGSGGSRDVVRRGKAGWGGSVDAKVAAAGCGASTSFFCVISSPIWSISFSWATSFCVGELCC